MPQPPVLKQRDWTEPELAEAGFRYHRPKRRVVLARPLPADEAPLTIVTPWDTLVAEAGYVICFDSSGEPRASLYDHRHWPVHPDHFADLYESCDGAGWAPTPAEQRLLDLGCRPWYKRVGVWARRLDQPVWVQSPESPGPAEVPAGAWLCVAAQGSSWGAPYSMTEEAFAERYEPRPEPLR